VLPVPASSSSGPVHLLTMTELSSPAISESGSASADHTQRLLVRQTLIEERERRRLGQALHDQVAQLLIQLRRHLAELRDSRDDIDCAAMIGEVDSVIHVLRELTFAISPPVLEDLGLLPALHWLAEHLRESYGAEVVCTDDGVEPLLASDVRTIAFRAVRELLNNAVKHAPGSSIRLSSREEGGCYRISVEDDGPGFSDGDAPDVLQQLPGYGLLSIEQQIRAIGGTFDIRSRPGSGTRATITFHTTPVPECGETGNA
jgi:signal transduction histidine kinase